VRGCLFAVVTAGIVGPRNIAVIRGSAATFDCVIDAPKSEVCWTGQSALSTIHYLLYDKGELTPYCGDNKCNVTFDNKTSRYSLTINSVQHYDAGLYLCRKCDEEDEQEAQLIVLQTGE